MHQAGIENVVASSGTSLTPGQIRLIHRFTNNITVLYDGDAAGIKASIRGIDLILREGLHIKVVLLPDGDDPDSFAKKQSAADFTAYIKNHETDFIRFKTRLLLDAAGNDPIKRATLIGDIVRSIAIIPDTILRSVYIQECARLLEADEKMLLREVNKIIRNNREQELNKKPVTDSTGHQAITPPVAEAHASHSSANTNDANETMPPGNEATQPLVTEATQPTVTITGEKEMKTGSLSSANANLFATYCDMALPPCLTTTKLRTSNHVTCWNILHENLRPTTSHLHTRYMPACIMKLFKLHPRLLPNMENYASHNVSTPCKKSDNNSLPL